MRRVLMVLALMLGAPTLGGCAAGVPVSGAGKADAPVLRIQADTDANGRRPVAVDVVRVADPALAGRLAGLDAAGWFRDRQALSAEAGSRIAIASWEMVPGQSVLLHSLPPFAAPPAAAPAVTFVYALYGTPGTHRQVPDGAGALDVRLGREGFTVAPLAEGTP
ncbi:hypothetical protein [Azospirillum isscasi]|uniref:Type VI secretion system protein n=1 Tax=Azospirillum isscasi TaxID=3053926 RepID=A0ABU0WMP6_9PROT|nr:hypothetical protein [Azospirillum isscasi]MDQ2105511.1 hypothetical protein [Azospirillum isscasi]